MTTEMRELDRIELEDRVKRMYAEVALEPEHDFHFETGRLLAERRRDQPLARQARRSRGRGPRASARGRLALADIVSAKQLPEGVTCDASLWAGCIGGAMRSDRYREAIEGAGFEIEAWRENDQYRFVSERADNATQKYGVTSFPACGPAVSCA